MPARALAQPSRRQTTKGALAGVADEEGKAMLVRSILWMYAVFWGLHLITSGGVPGGLT